GMIYSAVGILFVSLSSSLSSAFFGAGANILALLSSIISRWGIMIPYLIVSLYVLKAAPVHIWIGLLLAEIFEAIVAIIFFTKVRWEKKRVV
ncbi:MAG TPA: MATE family efflux transporter, partial [Fervidobacterium sp.]|nr:MATE family efflux transporter [Fervidobacterium sp.]